MSRWVWRYKVERRKITKDEDDYLREEGEAGWELTCVVWAPNAHPDGEGLSSQKYYWKRQ